MRGVETLLLATPHAQGKATGGATNDFSDPPATGDEFDRLMQASIARQPQRADGKNLLPAGKVAVTELTLPNGTLVVTTGALKAKPDISGAKVSDEKKQPATSDMTVSPDLQGSPVSANTMEANPVLVSLPFFLAAPVPPPKNVSTSMTDAGPANTGTVDNISISATSGLTGVKPGAASTSAKALASIAVSPADGLQAAYGNPPATKSNTPAATIISGTAMALPALAAVVSVESPKQPVAGSGFQADGTGNILPLQNFVPVAPAGLAAASKAENLPTTSSPTVQSLFSEHSLKPETITASTPAIVTAAGSQLTSQFASAAHQNTPSLPLSPASPVSTPAVPLAIASPATDTRSMDIPQEPAPSLTTVPDGGSEAALEHLNEAIAANAGTGVAFTELSMKNSQKTNKIAGSDVKVLPVGENGQARVKNLPPQLQVTPVRGAQQSGSDLNFSFANGNSNAPAVENTPVLNTVDLPSLADLRMRTLDRTHDMMILHSMRLVESKSDLLSVVIKPAIGTELSLELHLHPDGIQAQATVTKGDYQFLNQHWSDLQQKLEQRGIKLAPLASEGDFSTNDNQQYRNQQTSDEETAQQASAFAEFASVGATSATGGATARVASIHDGWESWA